MPRALITGISGQDGSYWSEYLLEKGYEVFGLVRRNSITENQQSRLEKISTLITSYYGDLADQGGIYRILDQVKPDEIYNLAAQSHVRVSFDIPQFTAQTNAVGVLNLLEAARQTVPEARFYQASSSEMFGNSVDEDGRQRETTPMHPVSPYGCAKLFGYSIVRNYRFSYGMFCSNGILFNHESPRRASNFVTSKIIKNAVAIYRGELDFLYLGNLDSKRDWGHAKDYVTAMHAILNHDTPDDFVISTGETHSIREFCSIVFGNLGLNYEDYVRQDERFMRPQELEYLCGDSTKAKKILNWSPKITFDQLVQDMLETYLNDTKK